MSRNEKRLLLNLIYPYRYLAVLIIFLSIIGSGFDGISIGLLVPLLSSLQNLDSASKFHSVFQWIIHQIQPFTFQSQILLLMGTIIIAIVLKNIFIIASIRTGHWLSSKICANLRINAMNLLLRVGIDSYIVHLAHVRRPL